MSYGSIWSRISSVSGNSLIIPAADIYPESKAAIAGPNTLSDLKLLKESVSALKKKILFDLFWFTKKLVVRFWSPADQKKESEDANPKSLLRLSIGLEVKMYDLK